MSRKIKRNREKLNEESIVVYLPTKMKDRWKAFADENTLTLSKFIRSAVNNYLFFEAKENTGIPREQMVSRIKELEEENKELKNEVHLLKMLSTNLDKDIKTLRLQQMEEGNITRVDRKLVYLLKNRGSVSTEELIEFMEIPPADITSISLLMKQLDILQFHRFVIYDGKRWLWNVT